VTRRQLFQTVAAVAVRGASKPFGASAIQNNAEKFFANGAMPGRVVIVPGQFVGLTTIDVNDMDHTFRRVIVPRIRKALQDNRNG